MSGRERIILVDGTALIFRAYFAIPNNFTTTAGLHTNAIYGFALMFKKLFSGRLPDRAAVIFDAPGRTFRDQKYPAYKAQREGLAPELLEQLPFIDRLVEAHNFRIFRVPGYEADDVIGTLCRLGQEAEMEVWIISGDKDFAQLVGPTVRMVDTIRDITYDEDLVQKKWGVRPNQFVDLLALMGDSSDNIPGVFGIGAKGAAKLLLDHGSLEAIYAQLPNLKGRQLTSLEEGRASAFLSKELARIDRHVPLPFALEALSFSPPEKETLNRVYRELEFYSLLSEEEPDRQRAAGLMEVEIAESAAALSAWLGRYSNRRLAVFPLFDRPGPVRGKLAGLAFSAAGDSTLYLPLQAPDESLLSTLRIYLGDGSSTKLVHSHKELWIGATQANFELCGVAFDTQLASFLIDPNKLIPHTLDLLAKEYLHRALPSRKGLTGSGQSELAPSRLPAEESARFAGAWAKAISELAPILEAKINELEQGDQLRLLDLPLSEVLGRMEIQGILVDPEDLTRLGLELQARLDQHQREIHRLAGHEFNIASSKQLGTVLFEELALPVIKKTKTGYSTNAEVLERLESKHPIAAEILEHRRLAKLINTYTEVLAVAADPATHRIHATFQQTVGVTGRLITTDPDLQRTPIKTKDGKRIRRAFVAPPGMFLLSADWSQIELRILAHFSRDPLLIECFQKKIDVHRRTACELFGCALDAVTPEQRNLGKTINFATIYGQGATALSQILGIERKEAQRYISHYFEAYAGVRSWLDATIKSAHESGYVTTLLGRRRIIPELFSNNLIDRQAGERIAANTPIQGSGADICKLAMLAIDRQIRAQNLGSKLLLQIHDELVFEAPEPELGVLSALVRQEMEQPYPLLVPLEVEIGSGKSWADAH